MQHIQAEPTFALKFIFVCEGCCLEDDKVILESPKLCILCSKNSISLVHFILSKAIDVNNYEDIIIGKTLQ